MLRVGAGGRHAAIVWELRMPVPFDLVQFVAGLERQRERLIRLRPFNSGTGMSVRAVDRERRGRLHLLRGRDHPLPRRPHPSARDRAHAAGTSAHCRLGPAHQPAGTRRRPGAHLADPRSQRLQHRRGTEAETLASLILSSAALKQLLRRLLVRPGRAEALARGVSPLRQGPGRGRRTPTRPAIRRPVSPCSRQPGNRSRIRSP
jgi:hypothetical protein